MLKKTMQQGEDHPVIASGNFIHVINGPVWIRTSAGRTYDYLPSGYGVETDDFSGFEVKSLSSVANEVHVIHGYGKFLQGADGSVVTVEIAPAQEVTVNGLLIPENVTFTSPVPIKPNSSVTGLAPLVIAAGVASIAASALRSGVLLEADETNTGNVWIGSAVAGSGIRLKPGDSLPLHTDGLINIAGTNGDTVYVLESLK